MDGFEVILVFMAFLLLGLPLALFISFMNMRHRLRQVEYEVAILRRQMTDSSSNATATQPTPASSHTKRAVPDPQDTGIQDAPAVAHDVLARDVASIGKQTSTPSSEPVREPIDTVDSEGHPGTKEQESRQVPPVRPVPPPPGYTAKPSRSRSELELIVGGKLLNRIGAVAIILGVLFLVKWAVDNDLISETARCLLGAASGIALVLLGERFIRKQLVIFGQGLLAASVPIFYLSVFAAFQYYSLVSQPVAFLLFVAVTVLVLWLALRHRSFFMSIVGAIGGLLVPAMLSTGTTNTVALHTYLILLDIGLLAIVYGRRSWRILATIAAAGTWIWWGLWYAAIPQAQLADDGLYALVLAALGGVVFFGFDVAAGRIGISLGSREVDRSLSIVSNFTWVSILLTVVQHHYNVGVWSQWTLLGATALYSLLAWWAHRTETTSAHTSQYLTLSVLTLAAAVNANWLDSFDVARGLALTGLGGTYIARRMNLRFPALVSWFVTVASVIILAGRLSVFSWKTTTYMIPDVWNYLEVAVTVILTAIAISTASNFARLVRGVRYEVLRESGQAFAVMITLYGIHQITTSICYQSYADGSPQWQYGIGNLWAIVATTIGCGITYILARRLQIVGAYAGTLTVVAVLVLGWFVSASYTIIGAPWMFIVNLRALSAVLLVAVAITMRRMPMSTADGNIFVPTPHRYVTGAFVVIVTLTLASTEAIWMYVQEMHQHSYTVVGGDGLRWSEFHQPIINDLDNKRHLTLSLVWVVYSALMLTVGFLKRLAAIRYLGIGLLGVSILKIFLYDLSSLEQPYRIISFIGLGLILLAASYAYARFKDRIFAT